VDDDRLPELLEADRQRCEVWTRVMGYHRPVSSFNIGKKGEYADRKNFIVSEDDAECAEPTSPTTTIAGS